MDMLTLGKPKIGVKAYSTEGWKDFLVIQSVKNAIKLFFSD